MICENFGTHAFWSFFASPEGVVSPLFLSLSCHETIDLSVATYYYTIAFIQSSEATPALWTDGSLTRGTNPRENKAGASYTFWNISVPGSRTPAGRNRRITDIAATTPNKAPFLGCKATAASIRRNKQELQVGRPKVVLLMDSLSCVEAIKSHSPP